MIQIGNVSKSFGDKNLFTGLNLEIEQGEFVIFAGASGCGKTTLLNMIGSLESIDEGKIIVDGIDIGEKKNQHKYLSEKVGFLFQNFALIEDKTVLENLKLVKDKNRTDTTIDEALQRVGLSYAREAKVYTLSGGEQQRIALARLMIKKCDLILADEPTGSLDKENGRNVIEILKELNRTGKTVIMVTHDEELQQTAERVIKL